MAIVDKYSHKGVKPRFKTEACLAQKPTIIQLRKSVFSTELIPHLQDVLGTQ